MYTQGCDTVTMYVGADLGVSVIADDTQLVISTDECVYIDKIAVCCWLYTRLWHGFPI